MTRITNTNRRHRVARRSMRLRAANAAIRRFVASAQRALPRDGPPNVRRARQLVAGFARQERRLRGYAKPRGCIGSQESPPIVPPDSCGAHNLLTPLNISTYEPRLTHHPE